ncbi:hypothetical protein PHYPSEUDO_003404 [Phytophthora pseudosyringae]|uniref:BAR domain-containing protein n=1 Tax=Phytophthora pseudosyringae TaxID=221518 RepID=A0A8T1WHG5_9STRA|nr:hypothetical protein PHYPSEUDO_003404 [Phytophthora pseudosyringae]
MSFSTLRRRATSTRIQEDCEEYGNDSCPLLGDEEGPSSNAKPQRILNVRRIDNGVLSPKRSLAQRIQSRKNRIIQRVLVACHLVDPSRDLTFKQAQTSNRTAIEQLTTIRSSLLDHSQSIVNLTTAICCFTGNSARLQGDDAQLNVAAEGHEIRECSLAFSDQAEKSVLAKIDRRVAELERIDSFIQERAKLVLDVEYAKRTLAVEHQKGNVNRVAERKQALQAARLKCERATRFITEQLKCVRPNQDTDMLELFQEYAQLAAQFFQRSGDLAVEAQVE